MSKNKIDWLTYSSDEEQKRELIDKLKYLDSSIDSFKTTELKFKTASKQKDFNKYRELFETENFNLIKLVLKFYIKYDNYGDFFLFILDNILLDDKNKHIPIKYDADFMFGFVLEIFKDKFQDEFKDYFRENLIILNVNSDEPADLEKRLKEMYEQDYNDIFFKKKCHK